jgi:hypothetical protein
VTSLAQRKTDFLKNDAILNQSVIFISRKKFLLQNSKTKNTLRIQKRILKSGLNCAFESKNSETLVSDAFLAFAAILPLIVLGPTLDYQ